MKSLYKWSLAIFLLAFLCFAPSMGSASLFNAEVQGTNFNLTKQIDTHVNNLGEEMTYTINQILNTSETNGKAYTFNGYSDNDTPSDWGCNDVISALTQQTAFRSYIYKENTPHIESITGYPTSYLATSDQSQSACLEFEHDSILNYRESDSSNYTAQAQRSMADGTVGSISFDVMCFLNISYVGNQYVPEAKFHVSLDNAFNTSQTIHLMFQTQNVTQNGVTNFTVNAYVQQMDSYGNMYFAPIFQSDTGDLNWIHVQIFYDCYNDVYNITMDQYQNNLSGFKTAPVSYQYWGQQHDSNFDQIQDNGSRYAPSDLVNTVYFWLESNAQSPNGGKSPSYAFIDDFVYQSTELAGVYADLNYQTTQISVHYSNNTLIVAYQPPNYPKAPGTTHDLSYTQAYFNDVLNPNLLTPFIDAPSWLFYLPVVVTDNDTLNINSLTYILDNVANSLETQGTLGANPALEYMTDNSTHFSVENWAYNSSLSSSYDYVFSSAKTTRIIEIQYYADVAHQGLLYQFILWNNSTKAQRIVYFQNGWGTITPTIPAYPIEVFCTISSIAIVVVLLTFKKRVRQH